MKLTSALPRGWQAGPLSSYCRIASGSTPKTGVPEYWDGDIPWLTPDDLSRHHGKVIDGGRRRLSQAGFDSCSTRLVPAGSVLYSSRAPIGYAAIASRPLCTNQGFKSALPSADLNPDFLYWQLIALTPSIRSAASGTTFKEISGKTFGAVQVVVPPVDEQQRIVAVLEDHLSRLDAAQAYLNAAERRVRLMKRSMLQREFHGLRVAEAPSAKLGDIADTALGKMLDAARSSGDPTPYLRNSNIRWGRIDLADVATVALTAEERRRFALTSGDLLVCEGGEPGRCAVWRGSAELMTFQKALHRVRVHALVEVDYVAAALQEFVQSPRADRVLTGTTIKHLPQERLRRIELPLPARAEQERVVALLMELESTAERAADELIRAKDQHRSLARSLLTAAFCGQL